MEAFNPFFGAQDEGPTRIFSSTRQYTSPRTAAPEILRLV